MKFGTRLRTGLLVLASVGLLASCSAIKLGYNNSVTIAYTYLSSKVDFSAEQSSQIKTSLAEIVQWHRRNELPTLARELETARVALAANGNAVVPVSSEQVQALNQAIRDSLRRTADHAAPLIAKNMLTLTPAQIQEIQKALDKSNKEYQAERIQLSPTKQAQASAERMTERFERWLGKLNPAQKTLIATWSRNDINQAGEYFQKRVERQQQFMRLAQQASNQQIDAGSLSQEIAGLLNAWQTSASSAERNDNEKRQKVTIDLVVNVLNAATVDQRNKAAERAAGWAEDFQILARND
ncbi:MAG: DUF6279 family lipoprotein [Limnobacter sp.]|uniref:DUF6279 family lipoprotein n=1 Tax=Limnobacter sp. TaxID=2003368 RepID=UPI0022CA4A6D|nr:DUF6279 family lipoprotein [Limnobacter sp.]MCZ8015235.1 DUF6279 family lipoprotein [Limnobacter sp.]